MRKLTVLLGIMLMLVGVLANFNIVVPATPIADPIAGYTSPIFPADSGSQAIIGYFSTIGLSDGNIPISFMAASGPAGYTAAATFGFNGISFVEDVNKDAILQYGTTDKLLCTSTVDVGGSGYTSIGGTDCLGGTAITTANPNIFIIGLGVGTIPEDFVFALEIAPGDISFTIDATNDDGFTGAVAVGPGLAQCMADSINNVWGTNFNEGDPTVCKDTTQIGTCTSTYCPEFGIATLCYEDSDEVIAICEPAEPTCGDQTSNNDCYNFGESACAWIMNEGVWPGGGICIDSSGNTCTAGEPTWCSQYTYCSMNSESTDECAEETTDSSKAFCYDDGGFPSTCNIGSGWEAGGATCLEDGDTSRAYNYYDFSSSLMCDFDNQLSYDATLDTPAVGTGYDTPWECIDACASGIFACVYDDASQWECQTVVIDEDPVISSTSVSKDTLAVDELTVEVDFTDTDSSSFSGTITVYEISGTASETLNDGCANTYNPISGINQIGYQSDNLYFDDNTEGVCGSNSINGGFYGDTCTNSYSQTFSDPLNLGGLPPTDICMRIVDASDNHNILFMDLTITGYDFNNFVEFNRDQLAQAQTPTAFTNVDVTDNGGDSYSLSKTFSTSTLGDGTQYVAVISVEDAANTVYGHDVLYYGDGTQPTLSSGSHTGVDLTNGLNQEIDFEVIYTDATNLAPEYVRAEIDGEGVAFELSIANGYGYVPYANGVKYTGTLPFALDDGIYTYSFTASNGEAAEDELTDGGFTFDITDIGGGEAVEIVWASDGGTELYYYDNAQWNLYGTSVAQGVSYLSGGSALLVSSGMDVHRIDGDVLTDISNNLAGNTFSRIIHGLGTQYVVDTFTNEIYKLSGTTWESTGAAAALSLDTATDIAFDGTLVYAGGTDNFVLTKFGSYDGGSWTDIGSIPTTIDDGVSIMRADSVGGVIIQGTNGQAGTYGVAVYNGGWNDLGVNPVSSETFSDFAYYNGYWWGVFDSVLYKYDGGWVDTGPAGQDISAITSNSELYAGGSETPIPVNPLETGNHVCASTGSDICEGYLGNYDGCEYVNPTSYEWCDLSGLFQICDMGGGFCTSEYAEASDYGPTYATIDLCLTDCTFVNTASNLRGCIYEYASPTSYSCVYYQPGGEGPSFHASVDGVEEGIIHFGYELETQTIDLGVDGEVTVQHIGTDVGLVDYIALDGTTPQVTDLTTGEDITLLVAAQDGILADVSGHDMLLGNGRVLTMTASEYDVEELEKSITLLEGGGDYYAGAYDGSWTTLTAPLFQPSKMAVADEPMAQVVEEIGITNVLTDVSGTSVTITWTIDASSSTGVDYGIVSGAPYEFTMVGNDQGGNDYEAVLSGLDEETEYFFHIYAYASGYLYSTSLEDTFTTEADLGCILEDVRVFYDSENSNFVWEWTVSFGGEITSYVDYSFDSQAYDNQIEGIGEGSDFSATLGGPFINNDEILYGRITADNGDDCVGITATATTAVPASNTYPWWTQGVCSEGVPEIDFWDPAGTSITIDSCPASGDVGSLYFGATNPEPGASCDGCFFWDTYPLITGETITYTLVLGTDNLPGVVGFDSTWECMVYDPQQGIYTTAPLPPTSVTTISNDGTTLTCELTVNGHPGAGAPGSASSGGTVYTAPAFGAWDLAIFFALAIVAMIGYLATNPTNSRRKRRK